MSYSTVNKLVEHAVNRPVFIACKGFVSKNTFTQLLVIVFTCSWSIGAIN